jgi:hypothetical protein
LNKQNYSTIKAYKMRTHIIAPILGCLAALLIAGTSLSQEKNIEDLPPVVISGSGINKYVNDKVERAFKKLFHDAANPMWYYLNKNYFVQFMSGEQENSALFSRKGFLIYHISYGKEEHLPADIRRMVKSYYVECSIPHAVKVEQNKRVVWVINVEDDANLFLIRSENGGLEEVKHYSKMQISPTVVAKKQ